MKKVLVALLLALVTGCAQLSAMQSAAGGSTPQSFSYPQNGLNGMF